MINSIVHVKHRLTVVACFLSVMISAFAQNHIIPLWDEVPNARYSNEKEIVEDNEIIRISLVQIPTLEVYLPAKPSATGRAIIICPGGGYRFLAYDWEGTAIAKWFNGLGITAFVLKYRLPNSESIKVSHEAPLQDAQRAMRIVRSQSYKWNINPQDIGIIGFSAGGHLASTLGTQFERPNNFIETPVDSLSARPDFMVLIYPVVTMKSGFTHKGSREALLGSHPSEALIQQFSNELQVSAATPATFIVHSQDDTAVPVENSLLLYQALKDHEVPVEMHLYSSGGHGYSMAIGKGHLNTWTDRLREWLEGL